MSALKRGVIVLTVTMALFACLAFIWRTFGPRNMLGAFLLNFLPTSWPPCVRSALVLGLPADYSRLRPFEQETHLYERLGIRLFQSHMRTPVFRICNRDIPRSLRQKDLVALEREMRFAETGHVLAFLLVLAVIFIALVKGWWDAVTYLIVWNILVNLYPVMLQRFNRGRLLRLAFRAAQRAPSEAESDRISNQVTLHAVSIPENPISST